MKATVRKEMFDAVMSYEEKPREKWIFDYPAQVSEMQAYIINVNRIFILKRNFKIELPSSFQGLNI